MSHKFTSEPLFGCKLHLSSRIFSPLLVSVGNFSHFVCLIVCSLNILLVCKLVCLCVTLKLTWMPTFICFFVVTFMHSRDCSFQPEITIPSTTFLHSFVCSFIRIFAQSFLYIRSLVYFHPIWNWKDKFLYNISTRRISPWAHKVAMVASTQVGIESIPVSLSFSHI